MPDYDLDSEDEGWWNDQIRKMELSSLKFEEMMDRLEKGSGQQVSLMCQLLPVSLFRVSNQISCSRLNWLGVQMSECVIFRSSLQCV